jgi:hypothetical protein
MWCHSCVRRDRLRSSGTENVLEKFKNAGFPAVMGKSPTTLNFPERPPRKRRRNNVQTVLTMMDIDRGGLSRPLVRRRSRFVSGTARFGMLPRHNGGKAALCVVVVCYSFTPYNNISAAF